MNSKIILGIIFCLSLVSSPALSDVNEPAGPSPQVIEKPQDNKLDITKEKVAELNKEFASAQGASEDDVARYTSITNQITNDLTQIEKLIAQKNNYTLMQQNAQPDLQNLETRLTDFKDFDPKKQTLKNTALTDAETTLTQIQTDLKNAKQTSSDLENEPQRRAKRITEIPELTSKLQEALDQINQKTSEKDLTAAQNNLAYIENLKNKVTAELNQRSIEAFQQELRAYEATKNLLPLQRDLAARNLNSLEKKLNFWLETVNDLRKQKLQEIKHQAVTAAEQVKYSNDAAKNIAKEIATLAQTQATLVTTIESTSEYLQSISTILKDINDDFTKTKELIDKTEKVTSTMGMLLMTKKESLPKTKNNTKNIKQRFDQISTAQFEWRKYDEQWSKLLDIDACATALLTEVGISQSDQAFKSSLDEMKSFITQKRKILSIISGYHRDHLTLLAKVDAQERDLVDVVDSFNLFIDKNILWVKAGSSFSKNEIKNSFVSVKSIFSRKSLNPLWSPFKHDAKDNYLGYGFVALLAALIFAFHGYFKRRISTYAEKIKHTDTDSFAHTINTMIISATASLPLTIILAFITWRYAMTINTYNATANLLDALKSITFITFIFFLLRWFTIKDGLSAHLKFDKNATATVRNHTVWLYAILISITMMYGLLESLDLQMEVKNSGLRSLFIIEQLSIAAFFMILFNPKGDIAIQLQQSRTGTNVKHTRYFWFFVILSVPLTFYIISMIGYSHAAVHLYYKLTATFFLYLAVLFCNRMLMRALFVSRRNLALKKVEEKRQSQTASDKTPDTAHPTKKTEQISDSILNISKQSKQIINVISTLVVLTAIWCIWSSTLPALEALENIRLGQTIDKSGEIIIISLASAIKAIVILTLTIFTAKNIPGLLEITILQRLKFDPGARFAFTTLSRYLLFTVGIIYSFAALGLRWSTVQWLVAAVTVGLGFGLQEIFANFISGLIILFEQPIRVGDYVTIGDISGEVTQIKIRATTILKWDRKELLVPNKEFITARLINWTLSDQVMRLEFPVGIAYGSDIKKAEAVLYEISERFQEVIQDDPKPRVLFKGFGDSTLDFELRVFIKDVQNHLDVWHQINCQIDEEFRNHEIEIAFPQTDLHLRSVDIKRDPKAEDNFPMKEFFQTKPEEKTKK